MPKSSFRSPLFVAAGLWVLTATTQAADIHINEFVTENLPRVNDPTAPVDMDGDYPDWIEIKNNEAVSVNLVGCSLSDNPALPAKWTFASTSVPAGGYLVVFAAGKNRAINNVQPHTSFKLASSGQLLLTSPGGSNIQTIVYSRQRQLASYGSENNTASGPLKYFTIPTPGAANNAARAVTNFVNDTHFDVDRGFFSAPFTVQISCSTTGATIAYTLNGSVPSPTNGIQVLAGNPLLAPTASVAVVRTTLLRARAWKTGMGPSDIDTQSYIFLGEVLSQNGPPASMNLAPADTLAWGTSGNTLSSLAAFPGLTFWGVNSAITNDANPTNRFVVDDLKHMPVVSVVMDWRQLFGTNTTGQTDGGIYPPASGVAIEGVDRAASLELLNPNGDPLSPNAIKGFQTDGNIHIFGGTSQQRWKSYKLSFRFQCARNVDYPVYGEAGAESFDNFVLDARINNTWAHPTDDAQRTRCDYVNDQVVADLQNAVSGRGGFHNRPVHLFLNGLYWGLYSLHEKPDHHFASAYYGGDSDDWDAFKHSVSPAFNESDPLVNTRASNPSNAVSRLNATVVDNYEVLLDLVGVGYVLPNPAPDLTILTNYEAVAARLDIDDFIDYMIVNFLAGNQDWSDKNLYATYYRAGGGKWRFHSWDAEHTFRTGAENFLTGNGNEVPRLGQPKGIHNKLKVNAEYRLKFADHLRRHLFNTGALTVAGMSAAFTNRLAEIDAAMRGESARWGHIRASVRPLLNVPYKRSDWLARKRSLLVSESGTGPSLLQNRWNLLMAVPPANGSFRTENLYPSVEPPDYNHYGGSIPAGFQLVMSRTNTAGVLYFTTDGTDPRVYRTSAVSPAAQSYSVPLVLNAPARVRARVLNNGQWSAITEAMFYPPQDLSWLVVSEIMYNPPGLGATNDDEFEFIELRNVGTNQLNLSDLAFTSGISFAFTNGTYLAPGQNFLLVRNPVAFAARYPGVVINGVYAGKFDNGGETVSLTHAILGTTVLSVTYNDRAPWPVTADGFGFSIVLRNPAARPDLDNGANWSASALPGGAPGAADPPSAIPPVLINEVLTASVLPEVDAIELFNLTGGNVDLGGWFLTDDPGASARFRIPEGTTISAGAFRRFTEADFNPTPGTNNSFSLNSHGDQVYLFSGDANTNLTGYSHGYTFGGAAPGVTFGRYVTSIGEEQFPAQLTSTLGTNNAGPVVGPVVINEVQYHPSAGDDEFVELRSISPTPVTLFDPAYPTNTWILAGLGYIFPINTTLGANELILLVATNPAVFRAKYSVALEVRIFGPYSGVLQDSGEHLVLQRPGTLDTNGVPYITVDDVRYNDKSPWPPVADGSGPSLQRRAASAYGNDPTNWTAAIATPGQLFSGGTVPAITIPPVDATVAAFRDTSFSVVAEGAPPLFYQWRHQGDDVAGATNAALILTNVQPAQAGNYKVLVHNTAGSVSSSNVVLNVLLPPNITQHPRSTNVLRGSNVKITVLATGNGIPTYQWRKDEVPLMGATDPTLSVTNVQPADEASYTVEVTDVISSIVSQPAYLKVIYRPVITENPSPLTNVVLQGRSATFRAAASGSLPLSFSWRRGSTVVTNMIINSNVCYVTLNNVQPAALTNVAVGITNLAGSSSLSSAAYLYILLDLDHDGLADLWEQSWGFSTNNPADATADADLDGMSNADEYVAGTNPLDPGSLFKIDQVETFGDAAGVLEFLAVSNRAYNLFYAPGVGPTAWTPVGTLDAAATNRLVRWTNALPAGSGFYRLRIPQFP